MYLQGLQNSQHTTSSFASIVQILKTDGQKTTEHTLNTLQYSVLKLKRGKAFHSIPSTTSHSGASKYKLPPWHQIWTLPGWHFTSGWNMISCYFAQCEGEARGIGFVKIEPWSWGLSGESVKSPYITGRTGAGM